MAQIKPEWEEISEFITMAKKIIEKYESEVGHVDPDLLVAYKCINKTKPESRTKLYSMSGQGEPEAFTNTKKYFVTVFHDTWDNMDESNRLLMVYEALQRIDVENPESGKVSGYDLHAKSGMVRTFGVDWETRSDVPNILENRVSLVTEPRVD